MKKISIIIAVVLSSLLVVQAAGLAKTCASVKGVTAVTITKEMLKLASMVSDRAPVDVMGLVDKLNQVELVSAPAADERRQVLRFVSSYLDENKGYKEVVSITDDDETINLYSKKVSTGLYEYLIVIDEGDELTAVVLVGSLTPEDVCSITDFKI